jgi:hypothetical protein
MWLRDLLSTLPGRRVKPLYLEPGTRAGRLVVLRPLPSRNGASVSEARCDCGNIAVSPNVNLRNGRTKSCGCLSREISRRNMLMHHEAWAAAGHPPSWRGDDYPRITWRFRGTLLETEGDRCQWPYCFWHGCFTVGQRQDVDHSHNCDAHEPKLGSHSRACRKCVRGLVHTRCNTKIREIEDFLESKAVIAVSEEVRRYLDRRPIAEASILAMSRASAGSASTGSCAASR